MTFKHGKDCEVVIGAFDLTTFFKGANFSADVDTAETSKFRDDWKTFVVGLGSGTVELDGFYDNVRTDTVRTFVATDTPFIATVGPAGLKVGDGARLVKVESTTYEESSSVGDAVMMAWGLQSTEEVFFGVGLKDIEVGNTGNGNGTGVDMVAQVVGASWCFHYHLTALSATNITIKVQDSADNVSFADVASATSGSLTAVGSGRVTGTGTVRRYVRVIWTVVGGATTSTFTAAFARRA